MQESTSDYALSKDGDANYVPKQFDVSGIPPQPSPANDPCPMSDTFVRAVSMMRAWHGPAVSMMRAWHGPAVSMMRAWHDQP